MPSTVYQRGEAEIRAKFQVGSQSSYFCYAEIRFSKVARVQAEADSVRAGKAAAQRSRIASAYFRLEGRQAEAVAWQ